MATNMAFIYLRHFKQTFKSMKLNLNIPEIIGYIAIIIVLCASIYLSIFNLNYFDTKFSVEDGFVEWATAVFLFLSSMLLLYRWFKFYRTKPKFWKIGTMILALMFLFAAGEEISWGQRLLHIQSSDFFMKNNLQNETNLHNLKIGDYSINKLIFGKLIVVVLIVYLMFLPVIYRKQLKIKTLVDNFAIPIVKWHHTAFFILSTICVFLIRSERKWEVYELSFALIFLLIFYSPKNIHIYKKTP